MEVILINQHHLQVCLAQVFCQAKATESATIQSCSSSNFKLFKSLRNVDYTNFIITEVNLQTLTGKKNIEVYLEFFKKYYLN